MGVLKDRKPSSTSAQKDGKPWRCPDGTYLFRPMRITVTAEGEYGIYTISWIMACTPEMEAKLQMPPLSYPTTETAFDANDQDQFTNLCAVIGKPMVDGKSTVWDDSGIISWNGQTDTDKMRLGRLAELEIESKEPNAKQNGGYWPIKYTATDISFPGEAAKKADALAGKLAARLMLPHTAEEAVEKAAPPPPVAGNKRK